MKIDELLPRFDFSEYHATRIDAPPAKIWDAIRHGDFAIHPIVRLLLRLRGLGRSAPQAFSLDLFLKRGFHLLAEDPPRELVLGIEGPFWKPACKLRDHLDANAFREPVPRGVARGAWNFAVHPDGTVSTETRVLCADDARAKFAAYWLFVRPFSGLIRRLMLRTIRRAVESK